VWGEAALRYSPTWLISTVMGLDPLSASTVPRRVRRQTALDYKRAAPQIMHIPASVQDLSSQAARLRAPCLVIWGKMDLTLHPESFDHLVSLLPSATGYALERTGHQPHIQRPQEVQQAVLSFLHQHHHASAVPPAKPQSATALAPAAHD
jgi:pimeloyl-ACP methyl ester carboxylesterase